MPPGPTIGPIKHADELPEPGPIKALANIDKMDEQERAELQIESQAVVSELLKTYLTSEKVMDAFIRWILPQWSSFWGRFQPDGTMSWSEFEKYVTWEQRWQGDTRRVFALLDPGGTGFITKPFVLETRRNWHTQKDTASSNVEQFKWKFANRWGTLGRGWRLALDTGDTGHCPQLQFMRCCSSIGMNRSLKTLWRKLTRGDVSRSICLKDLDPELDRILKDFVMALVSLHSTLREGWCAICRAGGGHLHEQGFEQACEGLNIDSRGAKLLFAALDPHQRRYLTEYDKLDFLEIWNPGNQFGPAAAAAAAAAAMADKEAQRAASGLLGSDSPAANTRDNEEEENKTLQSLANFEFQLVLSKDEYSEYLRRKRSSRIKAGLAGRKQEIGTQRLKKAPPGGNKPRPPSAPPKLGSSRRGQSSIKDPSERIFVDDWHSLAPNALGGGRETLSNTNYSMQRSRTPSSLGRLLSTPATTG